MHTALAERFTDAHAHPVPVPEHTNGGRAHGQGGDTAGQGSFLDLLAGIERSSGTGDRRDAVAAYQDWIRLHGGASPALFAAWFNLGVELSAAGDRPGAVEAYRRALALRPDFHPAALNLGLLLEAAGQPDAALALWQQALQPEEQRTALLEQRERLGEARCPGTAGTAAVLHVGCGPYGREMLPPLFRGPGWREIRLDIDPAVRPDVVSSITDMHALADGQVDAVYSSHNIEHLYAHEVPLALREMHRVLTPDGFLLITLPDLQEVARYVAEGRLDQTLWMSSAGPIAPIDILYGHRPPLAKGNAFMAHRTGFTGGTLAAALIGAGFAAAVVQRSPANCALTAIAFRTRPDNGRLATAQAQMLVPGDLPTLLYLPNG